MSSIGFIHSARGYIMGLLRVNELFSVIGSQRSALDNIGIDYEIVGISEIDNHAIKSYELLHGATRNYGDISKVEKLDYADIWTYSFPCQSISMSGKREGLKKSSNTKSSLLWEIERLLLVAKEHNELPKYLVLENVKNLVGKTFKQDFDFWLEILYNIGYNTYWKVVNAKDYGVGQNRERVIAVSIRKDIDKDLSFNFTTKGELSTRLKDFLEIGFNSELESFPDSVKREVSTKPKIIYYEIPKMVKVRTYDVDIPKLVAELKSCKKLKKLSNKDISAQLEQPLTLVEHWFRADRYNAIPSEDIWFSLKDLLGVTTTEFDESIMTFEIREGTYDQSNRVYDIEGVAPTITTISTSIRITDGHKIRTLTVREIWRLMGYTDAEIDKVINEVSEKQLFKQAGNSIVVGVLEEIFKEIVLKWGCA